ncbi:MAG: hypothetical protein AB7U20_13485 [Planctomycetaceae bacterium]
MHPPAVLLKQSLCVLIPVVVCALCDGQLADVAGAAERFQAGAVAVDITPTWFPTSSNGGMADRQVTGAHDPLHARCLVLDDGRTPIAIVVCDSCMIPRDIFDRAKQRASQATGIPASHMLMSATHTHTGVTATGVFQSDPDVQYCRFLVERIAEGVERAYQQRAPARVGWAVGSDRSQVFNRRWFTKAGLVNTDPFGGTGDRVRMNPGFNPDANIEPAGPIDPDVSILAVQSAQGRPIALLANYSLHYVGGVPGVLLSADYFGEFAQRVGERIGASDVDPPFVGIMSNGTSGNINNIDFSASSRPSRAAFEQIRVVAASVADAAFRAYQSIEYRDHVPLAMAEREVALGVRVSLAKDVERAKQTLADAGSPPYKTVDQIYARETILLSAYPAHVKVLLQAIRIGELGIVSSPCETFVETGLAIKERSPLTPTFTIELANGYNGYLPTPEHHDLGGYETWRARSSYLARDAEPKLRSTLLELLGEVAPGK